MCPERRADLGSGQRLDKPSYTGVDVPRPYFFHNLARLSDYVESALLSHYLQICLLTN